MACIVHAADGAQVLVVLLLRCAARRVIDHLLGGLSLRCRQKRRRWWRSLLLFPAKPITPALLALIVMWWPACYIPAVVLVSVVTAFVSINIVSIVIVFETLPIHGVVEDGVRVNAHASVISIIDHRFVINILVSPAGYSTPHNRAAKNRFDSTGVQSRLTKPCAT